MPDDGRTGYRMGGETGGPTGLGRVLDGGQTGCLMGPNKVPDRAKQGA
jgi:hypothetical protein